MARILSLLSLLALLLMPLMASALNLSNNSDQDIRIKVTGEFGRTCLTTNIAPGQTLFFEATRIDCQKDLKIDYERTNGEGTVTCELKARSGDHLRFDGRECRKC